jgi:hypothetical protein
MWSGTSFAAPLVAGALAAAWPLNAGWSPDTLSRSLVAAATTGALRASLDSAGGAVASTPDRLLFSPPSGLVRAAAAPAGAAAVGSEIPLPSRDGSPTGGQAPAEEGDCVALTRGGRLVFDCAREPAPLLPHVRVRERADWPHGAAPASFATATVCLAPRAAPLLAAAAAAASAASRFSSPPLRSGGGAAPADLLAEAIGAFRRAWEPLMGAAAEDVLVTRVVAAALTPTPTSSSALLDWDGVAPAPSARGLLDAINRGAAYTLVPAREGGAGARAAPADVLAHCASLASRTAAVAADDGASRMRVAVELLFVLGQGGDAAALATELQAFGDAAVAALLRDGSAGVLRALGLTGQSGTSEGGGGEVCCPGLDAELAAAAALPRAAVRHGAVSPLDGALVAGDGRE